MADQLNEKYNTEVKLVAGSGGCFEVTFDGKLIYSKLETVNSRRSARLPVLLTHEESEQRVGRKQ